MRFSVATGFLTLHFAPNAQAQTCGVTGPFTLSDLTGSCSYAVLVEEYTRQVFDVAGGTCSSPTGTTAKDDLDAKLEGAYPGLTAEEAGDALCKAMYDDDGYQTPFVNAADKNTDPDSPDYLHFEKQFYNGRGEWQEEVETIYEAYDNVATSVLREDAAKVREFFEGDGSYSRVTWPGTLTNFDLDESCSSHAAMCCWPKDRQANDGNGNCATPYDENCVNKDPADNTNLCFADFEKGNKSTGFDSASGFAVFPEDNNQGEGAIHCHGFAWADDEYDTISRYKANNLFFVSMYDHMHQRGYVENIPGMPMCACMDQMPMATRSDCTQVDLTEDWEVVFDGSNFEARLTKVEIDFNACRGRNNRNNDLWAYAARLYDEGRMTAAQFGKVGRVLTNDHDCYHAVENAKAAKGFVTDYAHDEAIWTKVAGREELKDMEPFGRNAFMSKFESSANKIIMRICPDCIASHRRIFYKRLTEVPDGFDLLNNILYHRSSGGKAGNHWGDDKDFTLHSTYEDAVSGDNPWKCNGDSGQFNYHEPFVGQCSPDGTRRHDQYSIFNWFPGPRVNVAYYVDTPEADGVQDYVDNDSVNRAVGLTDIDIGNVGIPGNTLEDNGTFHITASGHDIWWIRDTFHYKSQPWSGDIDVSVHLTDFTNPANAHWSKAGIMLRSDNSEDATYAFAFLSGKEGVSMQARHSKAKHAHTVGSGYKVGPPPYQKSARLRIVKKMETVEFYYSTPDGWVLAGTDTILFPEDSYRVGLAVSANSNSWLAEATFEDYEIAEYLFPTAAPSVSQAPTAWDPAVEINVQENTYYSGEFSVSQGLDIVSGVGSGLWGRSDSFFFYNEQYPNGGDVLSVEMYINKFNWVGTPNARGGIMIRDSNDPSAANAFVGAAGYQQGVVFQSRGAAGARTDHHEMIHVNGNQNFWVKLVKTQDVVTAYYKVEDGDAWIELGETSLALTGSKIQIGRAVTAASDNYYARETMQAKNYAVNTGV